MRFGLLVALSLVCGALSAQFKIIPQSKLDSVSNPRTVATALVVAEHTVDLGRVAENAVTERRVKITNSGQTPIMWHCRATCRCLAANGGVVKDGETAELLLRFAGKGFPGPFDHKLFIYQDSDCKQLAAVVRVKGYVVADADRSGDYPYHCAGLLLRQPGVTFDGSTVERIACKNGAQRAIRVAKDTLLSSSELELRCEPEVLQPGEEGDLVVTLKGEKRENLKLYIDAQMAPRTREIKIEVK